MRRAWAPMQEVPAPTRPARPRALTGFQGISRFWDGPRQSWTAQVLPGDFYVSRGDEVIATLLGSCVSVCIRDAEVGVGGMNHFMLPSDPDPASREASARYGGYALERLINELMKRGGRRSAFEVKIFGGGRVLQSGSDVGGSNIRFVRQYFATENMPVTAEDVGGGYARRLRYHPLTGRAMVHRLPVQDREALAAEERALSRRRARELEAPPPELF